MDSEDEPIEVDTLVVGGGVQGLTLLNELTERGFATCLVTNGDLGSGQTLHSHGVLNSGYAAPNPAIRESLEHDWLSFAEERGLETYGDDRFFVVVPPDPYEQLSEMWDAAGYPYEEVTPEELPTGGRNDDRFTADDQLHVVRIEEYTVPKRGLVRTLSDGLRDRIIKGDISGVRVVPADGSLTFDSVDITTHATGDSATVSPSAVVLATGTGTKRLLESIVDEPSFDDAVSSLGETGHIREEIREQVAKVTHERLHMICIRGPKEILPPVNLLLAAQQTVVVSADVDETHQHVGHGDTVTWYVTPQDPEWEHVGDVPDSAHADPDSSTVARGIDIVMGAFPPLREAATQSDSPVEFGVYAGYKQNLGDDRVTPMCERLSGVTNAVLALPTLVGGAWLNARKSVEQIAEMVEPSGSQPSLDAASEDIRIGHVRENIDGFEWLSWEQFSDSYPMSNGS